jgi:hypothetical protein
MAFVEVKNVFFHDLLHFLSICTLLFPEMNTTHLMLKLERGESHLGRKFYILLKQRFGFAGYACPVEIDLYDDISSQIKSFEAHCLVEEFMVLANSSVAQYLIASFPKCVPLRCQDPPSTEKVNEWIVTFPEHLYFAVS